MNTKLFPGLLRLQFFDPLHYVKVEGEGPGISSRDLRHGWRHRI